MSRRLAEVARKVGVSEATVSRVLNGKPGVVRADPRGGADRARRARLRAADQAARRARPAGRPGAARAAEPDLPGVRRGGRRRAGPAGLHAGAVHPDRRAASRRPTTSSCCSSSRCPASSSPAATTPSATPRTTTTTGSIGAQPAGRADQRLDRRAAVPAGVLRRRGGGRAGDRAPGLARATPTIGLVLGPEDHVPSERKLRAAQASSRRAGIELGDDHVVRSAYSLESRAGRRQPAAAQAGVTGIVCASDPLALGAIRAVRRAGLRVPGRRLGRRLRRLRVHELHRAAADHRASADRADGPGRDRPAGRARSTGSPSPRTSCSSSPSSWCAARPARRRAVAASV